MAVAKDEVTAVNVRRINKTEKTIVTTIIKRTIVIPIVVDDTITGDSVVLFNVVENLVKIEITVAATGILKIFIDQGIFESFKYSSCV